MSIFVLDCCTAMSWCFEDESQPDSLKILNMLKNQKAIVPSIWPLEVSNVLLVAERKKRIAVKDSETFIDLLGNLAIEIDMGLNTIFNAQVQRLARANNLSSYDAAYLELAMRYSAPLATLDKALAKAAKKEKIKLL